MRAILSDIHGNLEALTAVLADMKQFGVPEIFNLGDIVGYGPNPLECLELCYEMDIVLTGNFDRGTLIDPDGFAVTAERSINWTRLQLQAEPDAGKRDQRMLFLENLPTS